MQHANELSPHARLVEELYTDNAKGFAGTHDGYLNFGLWHPGITEYVDAAENLLRTLVAPIGLGPDSRVLDVACGRGTQDLFLDRQFGPLQIDAVDVCRIHVDDAKQRAESRGRGGDIRFHHGDATALPFENETFTHAIAVEGIVHFDTRERFLREAYRCLVPGGRLAIADYVLQREPTNRFERRVLDLTADLWKIPRENAITSDRYRATLESIGFARIDIEHVGAMTIPGYFLEQSRPSFRMRKIREQGFVLGGLGYVVDVVAYTAFKLGLIEYVLVRAQKNARPS